MKFCAGVGCGTSCRYACVSTQLLIGPVTDANFKKFNLSLSFSFSHFTLLVVPNL